MTQPHMRTVRPPGVAPASRTRIPRMVVPAILLAVALAAPAFGQADNAPVTRKEYEDLLKQMSAMRQEITDLRQERAAAATQPAGAAEVAALRKEVADLRKQRSEDAIDAEEYRKEVDAVLKDVKSRTAASALGTTKLLITGDAAVGFTAQHGSKSNFEAGVAPRFLWQLNDRILFDAAFDVGLGSNPNGSGSTTFDLTIANVSYIVNDYIVATAGLFVVPFGQYHTHFDPPWINPLPDDPLVFSDGGLSPSSALGFMVSGGIPISTMKLNYAVYVSNGPSLETLDADTAGQLHFDNYGDLNNNKAVGGRIGFLPVPELEMGYSIQCGQASPDGFENVHALLQAVDISYRKQFDWLGGTIHGRAEWIFSDVSQATYDPDGSLGYGPLSFNNNRNGGYVLASYRPTLASNKIIRNLELVFRYDRMDAVAEAPSGGHEQRYTVGLDYWFDPRVVLKAAWECDEKAHTGGQDAFMLQVGVGF